MATPIRIATVLAAAAALLLALGGPGGRTRRRGHEPEALLLGARADARRARSPTRLANDLIYHGGNAGAGAIGVETEAGRLPHLLGPGVGRPASRPPDTDGKLYSSKTLQNYVNSFFGERRRQPVGRRADAVLQRRRSPARRAASAAPGFVTNPKHQLKGVWTDPTPVPDDIVTLGLAENLVDDPIAAEAHARRRRTSATTRRRPTSS